MKLLQNCMRKRESESGEEWWEFWEWVNAWVNEWVKDRREK